MKKIITVLLVLSVLLLVGCGGSAESPLANIESQPQEQQATTQSATTPGEITASNETGYTFVELYSTPSSSTEFGEELLGGMRVDNAMTFTMTIGNINEPQDFLIVDNDGDNYSILGVTLVDGGTVSFTLMADSNSNIFPTATTYDASGAQTGSVNGEFIPDDNANATGYNTNGNYGFTLNNYSDYEIYSVHVGIANASAAYDMDLLPQTLPAGSSLDVYGFATQGDWLNTEWTLYITDVDGDTSASYDNFNPWSISSVDVNWDSGAGGYVVQFNY